MVDPAIQCTLAGGEADRSEVAGAVAERAGGADEEKLAWQGTKARRIEAALEARGARGAAALAGTTSLPGWTAFAQSGSDAPLRLGFQAHRTGIGAAYGRWYERTSKAAVKVHQRRSAASRVGRVELVIEDDGTDPKRGAEVVEKFANQHKVDFVFGTLFSHVVVGSAPTRRASSRCRISWSAKATTSPPAA